MNTSTIKVTLLNRRGNFTVPEGYEFSADANILLIKEGDKLTTGDNFKIDSILVWSQIDNKVTPLREAVAELGFAYDISNFKTTLRVACEFTSRHGIPFEFADGTKMVTSSENAVATACDAARFSHYDVYLETCGKLFREVPMSNFKTVHIFEYVLVDLDDVNKVRELAQTQGLVLTDANSTSVTSEEKELAGMLSDRKTVFLVNNTVDAYLVAQELAASSRIYRVAGSKILEPISRGIRRSTED